MIIHDRFDDEQCSSYRSYTWRICGTWTRERSTKAARNRAPFVTASPSKNLPAVLITSVKLSYVTR
jgi:ribonuclease I